MELVETGQGMEVFSPEQMNKQVQLIQQVMKEAMVDGQHYGKIPGCGDKPALLKPGAEKLLFTFRLSPTFGIERIDLPKGHREYSILTTITSIQTGIVIGQGVGSCSTMENKYRFRGNEKVLTENPVPQNYWDLRKTDPKQAQAMLGGPGFSTVKNEDGQWYIAKMGEKMENDNPADLFNTVLKMGKKRSLVDAILTVTAASDIFAQDIEENPELFAKTVVTPKPEVNVPNKVSTEPLKESNPEKPISMATEKEPSSGSVTPAQAKKMNLWEMLCDMYPDEHAGMRLKELTSFHSKKDNKTIPGKSDITKVSEKQVSFIFNEVKKEHDEWKKLGGSKPNEALPEIDVNEGTGPIGDEPPPLNDDDLPF